jgi:uncharacterized membrane protein YcaP (DUF421 family)
MSELLTSPSQIGIIILRTVIVYFFILVGFRLAGKREVGQLAPFDFALILLIANAVQNAMVGPDSSLVGGLVAAAILLALNSTLGHIAARNKKFERIVRGRARVLIHNGKLHCESLEAEGISREEMLQALRENGCSSIDHCRLALLEVDGTISVIARQNGD